MKLNYEDPSMTHTREDIAKKNIAVDALYAAVAPHAEAWTRRAPLPGSTPEEIAFERSLSLGRAQDFALASAAFWSNFDSERRAEILLHLATGAPDRDLDHFALIASRFSPDPAACSAMLQSLRAASDGDAAPGPTPSPSRPAPRS